MPYDMAGNWIEDERQPQLVEAPQARAPGALVAPEPYAPVYGESERMNPRRQLWAGMLMDMGNLFSGWNGHSFGGRQLRGTGFQMQNQARQHNARMDAANRQARQQYAGAQNAYLKDQQQMQKKDAEIDKLRFEASGAGGKSLIERQLAILRDPTSSPRLKAEARSVLNRTSTTVDALGNPVVSNGMDLGFERQYPVGGQPGGMPQQAAGGMPPPQPQPMPQPQQAPQPQPVAPTSNIEAPTPGARTLTPDQIKYEDTFDTANSVITGVNEIASLVDKVTHSGDGVIARERLITAHAGLMNKLRALENMGTLDAGSADQLARQIGDPSGVSLFSEYGQRKFKAKLETAAKRLQREIQSGMDRYNGVAITPRENPLPSFYYHSTGNQGAASQGGASQGGLSEEEEAKLKALGL